MRLAFEPKFASNSWLDTTVYMFAAAAGGGGGVLLLLGGVRYRSQSRCHRTRTDLSDSAHDSGCYAYLALVVAGLEYVAVEDIKRTLGAYEVTIVQSDSNVLDPREDPGTRVAHGRAGVGKVVFKIKKGSLGCKNATARLISRLRSVQAVYALLCTSTDVPSGFTEGCDLKHAVGPKAEGNRRRKQARSRQARSPGQKKGSKARKNAPMNQNGELSHEQRTALKLQQEADAAMQAAAAKKCKESAMQQVRDAVDVFCCTALICSLGLFPR